MISAAAAAILLAGPLAAEQVAETGKTGKTGEPVKAVASELGKGAAVKAPAADLPEKKVADVVPPAQAAKPKPAAPSLRVSINLTSQTMTVMEGGQTEHVWKISSGRSGYYTPTGNYRPQWMTRMHYSKKYDNAPMPHSVFFHGGYAIHATYATGALGRPASHGCIRLSPANAKAFYRLVSQHGKASTRISITGSTPKAYYAKRKTTKRKTYAASGSNYWSGGNWQAGNQQPAAKKYSKRKKPAAKPSYNYSYYKPKYTWPGD
ncbi:MAG: L,D-transpeptidase [Alphaproteobacteria bacterium]|nr:L,D-transpeptidase [Alphaproteobacteria bacterium]